MIQGLGETRKSTLRRYLCSGGFKGRTQGYATTGLPRLEEGKGITVKLIWVYGTRDPYLYFSLWGQGKEEEECSQSSLNNVNFFMLVTLPHPQTAKTVIPEAAKKVIAM